MKQGIFQDRNPAWRSLIADGQALFGVRAVHASGKYSETACCPALRTLTPKCFSSGGKEEFSRLVDANENQ